MLREKYSIRLHVPDEAVVAAVDSYGNQRISTYSCQTDCYLVNGHSVVVPAAVVAAGVAVAVVELTLFEKVCLDQLHYGNCYLCWGNLQDNW